MNWFQKLLSNPFLLIGLSSWFWAQLIKTIIHAIVTKSIDFTRLIGDGGMPSGHSATVSSLATAAALVYGLGSFEFAMAFIFAIVVCKDAMGVRLETGRQAVIINDIVEAFNSLAYISDNRTGSRSVLRENYFLVSGSSFCFMMK